MVWVAVYYLRYNDLIWYEFMISYSFAQSEFYFVYIDIHLDITKYIHNHNNCHSMSTHGQLNYVILFTWRKKQTYSNEVYFRHCLCHVLKSHDCLVRPDATWHANYNNTYCGVCKQLSSFRKISGVFDDDQRWIANSTILLCVNIMGKGYYRKTSGLNWLLYIEYRIIQVLFFVNVCSFWSIEYHGTIEYSDYD